MIFNSYTFLVFFLVFFALYWLIGPKRIRIQNALILAGSYVFYGWWDWRFLSLIVFSSLSDFIIAQKIDRAKGESRLWLLLLSIFLNLGVLFFFKYYNFFLTSWIDLLLIFNIKADVAVWKIILPVGISFYTFQTLSYSIDVYRGKMQATSNFVSFMAYVAFFPQLVAGPIERASHLLPQFESPRKFNSTDSIEGLNYIILGLFKKVVIADNCALFVNRIWSDYQSLGGLVLVLGVVLFAFQIYCDFSGYSDIAIGCARLLGFDLMVNFNSPYFAKDIGEFWKRWHISLSSWFRDYVYKPLGGSRYGVKTTLRNVVVVFLLSGLWHGANWTFIVWGGVNAFFFIPVLLSRRITSLTIHQNGLKKVVDGSKIVLTFAMVCIGWIFFRSPTLKDALIYLNNCFYVDFSLQYFAASGAYIVTLFIVVGAIIQLLLMEYLWSNKPEGTIPLARNLGFISSVVLILEVCFLGSFKNHFDFIYFQF